MRYPSVMTHAPQAESIVWALYTVTDRWLILHRQRAFCGPCTQSLIDSSCSTGREYFVGPVHSH